MKPIRLRAPLGMFGAVVGLAAASVFMPDGCRIDATQASMLMLAFSEIATNAIKYAHPTGLDGGTLPVDLEGGYMPCDTRFAGGRIHRSIHEFRPSPGGQPRSGRRRRP